MDKNTNFWRLYGVFLIITISAIIYGQLFYSECKSTTGMKSYINNRKIRIRKIQEFVENLIEKNQDESDFISGELKNSDLENDQFEEAENKRSKTANMKLRKIYSFKKARIMDVINYKNLNPQPSWCRNNRLMYLNSKNEIMILDLETQRLRIFSKDFYINYNAEEVTISWDCEFLMIAHSCKRTGIWFRECKYVVRHVNTRKDFAVTSKRNVRPKETPFLLNAVWGYHGNNLAFSENGSIYAFKDFQDPVITILLTKCPDYFCGSTDFTQGTFQKNQKGIFWHKFDFGLTYLCYNFSGTPKKNLVKFDDISKSWSLGNDFIRFSNSIEMLGDQRPSYYTYPFNNSLPIKIEWQKFETDWGPATLINYFGISSIKNPPSTYWVNVITNPLNSESNYATCYDFQNGAIKCKSRIHVQWGDLVADVKPGPYFVPEERTILGIFPARDDFQHVRKAYQPYFYPFLAAGGCDMARTENYQPETISYRSKLCSQNPLYIKVIIDFNQDKQEVYVSASTAKNSSRHDIWLMKLQDIAFEPQCLTCGILEDCLEFKASMDPLNWKYFLVDCHGPAVRHTRIFSVQGMKLIQTIDNNNHLCKYYQGLQKPKIEFLYPAIRHEKISLRIKLYLPLNIKPNEKIPLLLHTSEEIETPYAGYSPSFGYSHYLALTKRWAVIKVDGRGKNLEGFKRIKTLRYKIGIKDLQDYSDGVEYVLQKYTFLDNKKIGIWGKGYGGYTGASLMGAKPVSNLIFKCGAALSPIARFSNLSHTFFHRYFPPLTNPWESTDPLIYTRVDLLHRIRAIRNNSFLLMHGALQRDVPLEQSMWLSKALLKANVNFEQIIFQDVDFAKEEMIRVYRQLDDFFAKCFA